MDDVASGMISLAIKNTENADVQKGLQMALDMMADSEYTSLTDWEDMLEEEKLEMIEDYLEI